MASQENRIGACISWVESLLSSLGVKVAKLAICAPYVAMLQPPRSLEMAKQSKEKNSFHVRIQVSCERVHVLHAVVMSEQYLRMGKAKSTTRAAIPHASIGILYAVKTFLVLAKQNENEE